MLNIQEKLDFLLSSIKNLELTKYNIEMMIKVDPQLEKPFTDQIYGIDKKINIFLQEIENIKNQSEVVD